MILRAAPENLRPIFFIVLLLRRNVLLSKGMKGVGSAKTGYRAIFSYSCSISLQVHLARIACLPRSVATCSFSLGGLQHVQPASISYAVVACWICR